jgi:hypothetical protein
MGRLIDILKQASHSEPPPLGFRTIQKNLKPKLLVIASVGQADLSTGTDIADVADALLFNAQKAADVKAAEKAAKTVKNIPCGCRLNGSVKIDFEKTVLDFVVFDDNIPAASLLKSEKTDKVIVVDNELPTEAVRVLDTMPQNAFFLDEKQNEKFSLTWQKLTVYKRFALLASKPLLVSVPLGLSVEELQAIWDMGVCGVVVQVNDTESIEALKKLKKDTEKLVVPSKRKQDKSRAIVPQVPREAPVAAADDDDEDDE